MLVTTTAADLLMGTGISGSTTAAFTSTFSGAKLILATNQFQPSKTRALADLQQPTYTGYAAQTLTWGAATYDPNGQVVQFSNLLTFKATSGAVSITAYGFGITNAGGTVLYASDLFLSPLSLIDLNSTINVIAALPLQISQTGQAVAFQ